MVGVAVFTPVAVALRHGHPTIEGVLGFFIIAAIAVLVLALREAVKRRFRSPGEFQRRLTVFVVLEGTVTLGLVGALGVIAGRLWFVAILVIPAAIGDVLVRRRGYPNPLGGELAGIGSISLVVPAGAVVLSVGDTASAAILWALFVGFHVEGVLRVKAAIRSPRLDVAWPNYVSIAIHAVGVLLTGAGFVKGLVGPAAPILFAGATTWAAWQATGEAHPDVPKMGRRERLFSILFVVGAPWLL